MRIFELSKSWPQEERYALTGQIRRSPRAVCGNLAEAWLKRRYVPSFVSKLSDASSEAAETLTWLDFALACHYIDPAAQGELKQAYRQILGGLTKMMAEPDTWCGPAALRDEDGQYRTRSEAVGGEPAEAL
jgi:four helix bundle protein